jgi:hypothetical protein
MKIGACSNSCASRSRSRVSCRAGEDLLGGLGAHDQDAADAAGAPSSSIGL